MTRGLQLAGALPLALAACGAIEPLADTAGWWDEGTPYEVAEPLRFTPEAYPDLPGNGPGIGGFIDRNYPASKLTLAPGDGYASGVGCDVATSSQLPVEIEGIATLHPRWYMKLRGCNRAEEKYYGNWFIEDATGGIFVAGDTKVAHFDAGDRVRLRVRGVLTNFGMDMVYVYDVLEIHREGRAIYYQAVDRELGPQDIGETRRVRGTVVDRPDTFGAFRIESASGAVFEVNLDAELNRRRVHPPVGSTLCATGPVQFSFSTYSIPIMRIGQLATVDADEPCPDEP